MKIRNCFALGMLAWLPLSAADQTSSSLDVFLNQPVPSQLILSPPASHIPYSHKERITELRSLMPRQILFPDGFADFVAKMDQESDWTKGTVQFLNEGFWITLPSHATMRAYIDRNMEQLGLSWEFDPKQNEVVTNFKWHREDQRSSNELLKFLASTPSLPPPIGQTRDSWQNAFDALLSKPDNFAKAWRVRFCADQRYGFGPPERSTNLTSGKIKDEAGAEHFLIVNNQPEMMNPGPQGTISYYLFDPQGKFESGGIITIGYRCFNDSAWLETTGTQLDVRTFNNGSQRRDLIFSIVKGRLIRTNFLIDGMKPTNGQLSGMDMGGAPLYISDN